MSEVIFSKKQIGPLVEKYQIDVNKNEYFNEIIKMFADQINYQVWAIKLFFEGRATIDEITRIKGWADVNQTEIKNLVKGNIISYKTKADVHNLFNEMRGLDMVSAVRSTINKFNTRQKDMMRKAILDPIKNGQMANSDSTFAKWYKLFKNIEAMSNHRKEKLISLASAIEDMAFMEKYLNDALVKSYEWNKEDMLAFMNFNCRDCKVVFDEGNYVIIDVPSFKSSKALCGAGRTSWCLTRQEQYFKSYVKEPSVPTHQYFYFNFGLKENDELAHVGFTVQEGRGITNAHSTKNQAMVGEGIMYNGKRVNINDVLASSNVPLSVYIKLKELINFKWDIKAFMEFIANRTDKFALCMNDGKRVVVRALTDTAVSIITNHTLIPNGQFRINNQSKAYFLLDFEKKYDDINAFAGMYFVKDTYKFDKLTYIFDAFNNNLTNKDFFRTVGIETRSFLDREKIDERILLHKFIDEKNEKEAIETITKGGDNFDVNYEFNGRKPIFMAIDNRMYELFAVIVNHPKFDSSSCNFADETLLESLIYNYKIDGVTTEADDKCTRNEIEIILGSKNMDFNAQDINFDTALNISCETPERLFIVEALVKNEKVDLNIVNDFNCTALTTAIRYKNIDAIKLLATRKDLVVRHEDVETASKNGINLHDFISDEIFETSKTAKIEKHDSIFSDIYSELFAKAFAEIHG